MVPLTLPQRLLYQVFLLVETLLTRRDMPPANLDYFIVYALLFYLPDTLVRQVVPVQQQTSFAYFRHLLTRHFFSASADALRHLFQNVCDAVVADQLNLNDFDWPGHLAACNEIIRLLKTIDYSRQVGMRLGTMQHNIMLGHGGGGGGGGHVLYGPSPAIVLQEYFNGLNISRLLIASTTTTSV